MNQAWVFLLSPGCVALLYTITLCDIALQPPKLCVSIAQDSLVPLE